MTITTAVAAPSRAQRLLYGTPRPGTSSLTTAAHHLGVTVLYAEVARQALLAASGGAMTMLDVRVAGLALFAAWMPWVATGRTRHVAQALASVVGLVAVGALSVQHQLPALRELPYTLAGLLTVAAVVAGVVWAVRSARARTRR